MKKLACIVSVIAALAMNSSAVSVAWTSSAVAFGDSGTLKNNPNITGYLVYLSSGDFASSYTVDDSFSVSSIGTKVDELAGTVKSGKVGKTYSFTEGSKVNGDTFALLVSYNDGTDTYYQLSSVKNALSGLVPGDPTYAPNTWSEFTIISGKGTDGTLTAGGGWVKAVASDPTPPGPGPIPEPATGALALAGVALLFKRRRA